MMRSGRKVPTPAIPIPDFAVPYAAPIARYRVNICPRIGECVLYPHREKAVVIHPKIIAAAMPP